MACHYQCSLEYIDQGRPRMSTLGISEEIAAALRDSMSPGDRVASWSLRWSLLCGQVVCAQCQAAQSANQTSEPFRHRSGCRARRDEQPLQELSTLLTGLGQPSAVRRSVWS
jgi:hypothetical protein